MVDYRRIDQILSNYIESEKDLYKRRLKQIALKGILLINEVETPEALILLLNNFAGIQDGCVDKACEQYEKGDAKVFKNLFKKGSDLYIAMNQTVEREEITLIRRALEVLTIVHREGYPGLNKTELEVTNNTIFEYGICLIRRSKHVNDSSIKSALNTMIRDNVKTASYNARFYQAQMAVIISILKGEPARRLFEILLSYFGNDISVVARKLFKNKYDL
jgi:hypothetical protein